MNMTNGNSNDWWLVRMWKNNPEGLLLMAAGGALMLRAGSSSSRNARSSTGRDYSSAGSDYLESARGNINRSMNEASGYASNLADQARQATSSYASSAADYTRSAADSFMEQSNRMVDQGRSALSTVEQTFRDQPLLIGLAGLAIGAAAAAAFAPTEMEKRTIGPMVQQTADQLKQATANAGSRLKEAAEERGLSADGLKDVAAEVGEAFTSGLGGGSDGQRSSAPDTKPQSR